VDREISDGRKIALSRLFQYITTLDKVEEGFDEFSPSTWRFEGSNVIKDMGD